MQGILLTRHCQVEVISTLKEHPKEEEQTYRWAGIARYRLVHMHKSILLSPLQAEISFRSGLLSNVSTDITLTNCINSIDIIPSVGILNKNTKQEQC